jgi:hypothetical protein
MRDLGLNDESVEVRGIAVVYFKILYWNLHAGAEKIHNISQDGPVTESVTSEIRVKLLQKRVPVHFNESFL